MKFFSVTVISLSLGCQVLAAPIEVPAPVTGVEALAAGVPSGAVAAAGSLPVVGTLTSAVPDTGLPIVKKSIDIATITGAGSGLKSHIAPELSTISKPNLALHKSQY
jgi:hypothetical protein